MSLDLKKYMGIPYAHQGRTREGLDCWGLIRMIFQDELGIDLMDIEDLGKVSYDLKWSRQGEDYFMENYAKNWERVQDPEPFDVPLFKNGRGVANHVGVMVDLKSFLHCNRAGVVLGRLNALDKDKVLEGFFRYKK